MYSQWRYKSKHKNLTLNQIKVTDLYKLNISI